MRETRSFLYTWGPFLAYCVLILGLSSFSRIPAAEGVPDKWLHFLEYVLFAALFWRAVGGGSFRVMRPKQIAVIFIAGSAFGGLEELYQSLIPGRNPSVADWTADVAGIFSMITLMMIRNRSSAKGEA